ncbi:hypothetical protein NQ318_021258 [Aromia moschata]|uniref:SIAH-type domain-containing protein n=1 Tax=Aromia moschata TaxID=1265417 RepID=A0AAV8ZE80_9CUCU|nr:hypothetical protein NQ318_021258 [Aromia moschata]
MLQIPQYVLENLKCAVCDGYLSTQPLMIKPEGEQVCGKCFRIISSEEKEKCLREVGLETLAQLFLFPCRYNRQGCNYTFAWGNDTNHEEVCLYRYKTSLPSTPSRLSYGSDYYKNWQPPILETKSEPEDGSQHSSYYNLKQIPKCDSDDASSRLSYELKDRNYGKPSVTKNESASELQNNINLSIEGAVSLQTSSEKGDGVFSTIRIQSTPGENLYDSPIDRQLTKRCSTCKIVVREDAYTCLFGHVSCGSCKSSMCKVCINLLEKESKTMCTNYKKGCKSVFMQSEIAKHQSNCPYNDHRCPLEPCRFKGVLGRLKLHLKQSHLDKVYATSEATKCFQNKDETIVLLCYDSVFKCVYFYYKTFVEFFVTYIGSSEEALDYSYEIWAQPNANSLRRQSRCSSWNDSMLEKGITFDKKELVNNNEKKLNFEIRLRILHLK